MPAHVLPQGDLDSLTLRPYSGQTAGFIEESFFNIQERFGHDDTLPCPIVYLY
jgi:hypothetical protein